MIHPLANKIQNLPGAYTLDFTIIPYMENLILDMTRPVHLLLSSRRPYSNNNNNNNVDLI